MQFFALTTLFLSVAIATPTKRQSTGFPGANVTESGSCLRYSVPRTCEIGGNRVLTCLDYESICEVNWTSAYNQTDSNANAAACAGKASGDACAAVYTCCPASN